MRLTENQIKSIRNAFSNHLNNYELRLFGSRTDDSKKGGDIDLLILTEQKLKIDDKWTIRREIESSIGEQKIDIVNFTYNQKDLFKDLIIEDSVKL